MAKTITTSFMGDANLGLFGFATDRYCVVGASPKNPKKVKEALKVPIIKSSMLGTDLTGVFSTGNSDGIIVADMLSDYEIEKLKEKVNVLVLDTRYTAIGNLVLMNDYGCVISKLIKKEKNRIERFFGLDCAISNLKLNVIGSLAIATNRGCLVYPEIKENYAKEIERALKVKVDIGTANFGSMFVGSCLIANSYGLLVSNRATGVEVARIEETLFGNKIK